MATISAAQSTGIVTLSGSTNDVVTISSAVGAITIINVSGTSPLSVLAGAVDPGAITAGQAGTFTVLPNSYITLDAKYGQQVVVRVVGSGNQYTVQGAGRASMGNYLDSNQLAGLRSEFAPAKNISLPLMRTGPLYLTFPIGVPRTTVTMVEAEEAALAVMFSMAVTLDRIGIEVTGAGSAGAVVRMGVRADNGGVQGALLSEASSTIDASTTGVKEAAISQPVLPNVVYWLSATCQGSAATKPTVAGAQHYPGLAWSNIQNFVYAGLRQTGVTGSLPTNPSGLGPTSLVPRIHVRYS